MKCIECGKPVSTKNTKRCKKCFTYYSLSKEYSLKCMETQNFVDCEPTDTIDEVSERNYGTRIRDGFAMMSENY
jgi:predicted ATP-dependent serine protease